MTFENDRPSTVREDAAVVPGPSTIRSEPLEPPAPGPAPVTSVRIDHDLDTAWRFRRDLIRWGPVWAGFVVALGTYLFLQLALVAGSVVELAEATRDDAYWSAGAALVAFFLGGVVAGATAMWRGIGHGLLHGLVLWAVGIVALLVLSAVGGGIALGAFDTADVFDRFAADDVDTVQANEDAEDAAGWALLGIGAALAAAAIGGALGAKIWPRRDHDLDDEYDRYDDDADLNQRVDR